MSTEVLGNPELVKQIDQNRATIRVRLRLEVDPQKYLQFMSGLVNTLDIVAKEKKTEIGFNRFTFENQPILGGQDDGPKDPPFGLFCKKLYENQSNGVCVVVNIHRTQDNGRTEWVCYWLDEIIRPDLNSCCRDPHIKLSLLADGKDLHCSHAIPRNASHAPKLLQFL